MQQHTLTATPREEAGRRPVNRLRATGRIPAVLYGPSGSRSLSVDERAFELLLKAIPGQSTLVEIQEEGAENQLALIQDTQRNAISRKVVHIDFLEVKAGEKLTTSVAVVLKGEAAGIKEGAVLEQQANQVEVTSLPKDLPESIEYDVSEMKAGDMLTAGVLALPAGVELSSDPATTIATCAVPVVKEAAEDESADGESADKPSEES